MGEAYDQVVARLGELTPEERGRVAERLRLIGAVAPQSALAAAPASRRGSDGDEEALALLEVITDVVLRASGERTSAAALRRTRAFSALRDKARDLGAFVARHAPDRAARRALLVAGVELLYRDLARAGFSVSSRTLMSYAHQVPAALDRAFPGYAASGLLGMVVGRTCATGHSSEADGDGAAAEK